MHSEFYLPFANQFAFEKLNKAATRLISRYLRDYGSDLFRVWVTEHPFELHLDSGTLTGRADVILDNENGKPGTMAIVDYKTSTAADDAAYSFQLAVYAAAGRAEGIDVRAAYVHELKDGKRKPVTVDQASTDTAKNRAQTAVQQITARKFPPRPTHECTSCDVRFVCNRGPER